MTITLYVSALSDGYAALPCHSSSYSNAIKLRKLLAALRLASPFGGSAEGNRGMLAVLRAMLNSPMLSISNIFRQYRYVAPSSHFVRNGVSLDFRVASLLKIQFACTSPSGSSPDGEPRGFGAFRHLANILLPPSGEVPKAIGAC